MLPMPLTIEAPDARIAVGYTSPSTQRGFVFVTMVKNWNRAPRTRIAAVLCPKAANARAVRQPRIPAV